MGTRTQYSLNDLTGTANKHLRVNSGETGIETYDTKITNTYRISKTGGDFEFIGEAFAFLNALPGTDGVRLILDAGLWDLNLDSYSTINGGPITIDSTHPIYFEGSGVNTTIIRTIDGHTNHLFKCNSSINFSKIRFTYGTNNDLFGYIYLNNENVDFDISDVYFDSANAIDYSSRIYESIFIRAAKSVFVFNFVIEGSGHGIYCGVGSGTTTLDIEVGTISHCFYEGINLDTGTNVNFDIHSVFFYPGAGKTGIIYNPAGFTYANHPSITGCKWDNTGTFMSGFDFSRHDGRDRNIVITNNVGMENKNPHAYLNMINNTATTVLGNGVWTKLNFTGSTFYENKIIFNGNRFTYLPSNRRDLTVFVSGTFTTTTQLANIEVVIVKNGNTGTTISPVSVTLDSNSKKFQWSANAYLQSVGENDYFEIWGRGIGAKETIILEDMNLLITSV